MRNVITFCEANDPYKPDFIGMMIDDSLIRRECGSPDNAPLTSHESTILKNQVDQYYKENWSKVILVIMRYKNPLIANVNQMTSLSEVMDENQEIYFHMDWLKPGRHVYVIEHSVGEVAVDDDDAQDIKKMLALREKISLQKGFGKKSTE